MAKTIVFRMIIIDMARDNFTTRTARVMAERVGFLCSNPDCRANTVGPNNQPDKSTRIGEAAHITAAAVGGPRYDSALTPLQRMDIDNGIWLCSNCADLIDKDVNNYSVLLLRKWKADAEHETYQKISGRAAEKATMAVPYIEVDLEFMGSGRMLLYHSDKNPTEYNEDGLLVMPIYFDGRTISFWELHWEYSLNIHNNSSVPAYNVRIEQVTDNKFTTLQLPAKVNSLKAHDVLRLSALYKVHRIEKTAREADEILRSRIPKDLEGLELNIRYQDESRNDHRKMLKISGQDFTSVKN